MEMEDDMVDSNPSIHLDNLIEDHEDTENSDRVLCESVKKMVLTTVNTRLKRRTAKKLKRKRAVQTGSDADDETKAYSRCSVSYFYQVLERVRSYAHYSDLVRRMGFGDMLELDDCCIPRDFVQWVADNVNTDAEDINIDCKSIHLTPQSVSDSVGVPSGNLPVDDDEEWGKACFLALFGLSEVPSIRFFGSKILQEEILPDDVFCRCFMSVCLGTFLCPNSNTKLSTKYMGALIVVEKIKERNWAKFVHEWMVFYIKKYLQQRLKNKQSNLTLGGCIYHLAVRCLDFIDFGGVHLPGTLPRIRVWKGNLLKLFSEMYMDRNGKYGAYPVRDLCNTCYAKAKSIAQVKNLCNIVLRESMDAFDGDLLTNKVKEVISNSFTSHMMDQDLNTCLKDQSLVLDGVHAFLSYKRENSQDTLKLNSSQDNQN